MAASRARSTAARRRAESIAGLAVLGVPEPICWGYPDACVLTEADLAGIAERAAAELAAWPADVVYLPWSGEHNSDHRALHVGVARALRRQVFRGVALGYEIVGHPLEPELLIDIESCVAQKRRAIGCYETQLRYIDSRTSSSVSTRTARCTAAADAAMRRPSASSRRPERARPMTPQPARSATALTLTPRAASLARKGQLWFYADDVDPPLSADTEPSLVRLADHEGRDLGLALCSPRSKLCFRRCGRWPGEGVPSPAEFLRVRLAAAIAARAAFASPEGGARLVHGEADELPGLVVDGFADCLVVHSAPRLEAMCADLVEVLSRSVSRA